jgi:hypothetical protein
MILSFESLLVPHSSLAGSILLERDCCASVSTRPKCCFFNQDFYFYSASVGVLCVLLPFA